ncbi:hypothetical protein M441DRAFT_63786 [Trichoderma asperellum CBS 433.97]|uniref:RTA1 like protein n=1 Tax=Trichoderma asperellum (strain ATCC 204424 / CBS 433.97 / NBRC 101777) TaxID=1042311 RepID=A0A2T3ZNY6_TRIA4|nr:hypothetical protein M441DRAFT_63786 [Trichoderma asperellum CBS 433.97]PTB46508.1 hypothetical protein M441DRAFT_63786 [Trichoderma asperellum CBS 433.97]
MGNGDNCNPNWKDASFSYYKYVPSLAAAGIFTGFFFLAFAGHSFRMIKARAWFLSPLVIGCLFEVLGFAGRAVSANQEPGCWTQPPYLVQTLFILLAPALFAASVYMTLGRIIEVVDGEKYAIIKRRWLTKIFVCGDIVCFLLLGGGGGMLASAKTNKSAFDLGNNIIIGGLVLQLLWFGLFVVITLLFHRRMMLSPTARSYQPDIKWRSYLHALYVASALIIVRNIFRLIEYCQGSNGYLMTTEVFVYCLDALPMFLVVAWFLWKYPGEISGLLRRKELYDGSMHEI